MVIQAVWSSVLIFIDMATTLVQFDVHFSRASTATGTPVRFHSGGSPGVVDPIPVNTVLRVGSIQGPFLHLGFEVATGSTTRTGTNNSDSFLANGWLKYSRLNKEYLYIVKNCAYTNASGKITVDVDLVAVNNDMSTEF